MGEEMLFAFRSETGVLGHRETDGTLHFYRGLRTPEDWVDSIDFSDRQTAQKIMLDRLEGGGDAALRGFITETALASYEAALFPRAAETAADSAESLTMLFGPESPKNLVETFAEFDAQAAADQTLDIVQGAS